MLSLQFSLIEKTLLYAHKVQDQTLCDITKRTVRQQQSSQREVSKRRARRPATVKYRLSCSLMYIHRNSSLSLAAGCQFVIHAHTQHLELIKWHVKVLYSSLLGYTAVWSACLPMSFTRFRLVTRKCSWCCIIANWFCQTFSNNSGGSRPRLAFRWVS